MCGGEAIAERAKPPFRSLKELRADFEQRRSRSVLRPLDKLAREFARRRQPEACPKAFRPLAELTADFEARRAREARTCSVETAACRELSSSPAYSRDELLAVLGCMRVPAGAGRGARIRTVRLGPPPGLCEDSADPALDDEELLARLEAREDRERGADAHNEETFGPHAQVEGEEEAYLSEAWAVQQAEEYQDFWWSDAQGQQHHGEDVWDFSENFAGFQDCFWAYPQGFGDGFSNCEAYYSLADKASDVCTTNGLKTCSSSTAPTEKESDADSGGDEAEARQAVYW